MKKVICLLSGGMDSATLLYWLKSQPEYDVVGAIGFNYGQRHVRELAAAEKIAQELHVPYQLVNLTSITGLLQGTSQTDMTIDVPEGHFEDESMKLTVVPNRNMIMLSIAVGWAISLGAEAVAYAAHAGDHAVYPDCRSVFMNAIQQAMNLCHYTPIDLLAPFVNKSKADIVAIGAQLGVPYEKTWSCYKGGEIHCGRCGTCQERIWAFRESGYVDLTTYAQTELMEKAK